MEDNDNDIDDMKKEDEDDVGNNGNGDDDACPTPLEQSKEVDGSDDSDSAYCMDADAYCSTVVRDFPEEKGSENGQHDRAESNLM